MKDVYQMFYQADIIVFASPVYFYTWTSQIKAVIDRSFAIKKYLSDKVFYLISTCAAPDEMYQSIIVESFRKYLSCFKYNIIEGGVILGFGTNDKGDFITSSIMDTAYQEGYRI